MVRVQAVVVSHLIFDPVVVLDLFLVQYFKDAVFWDFLHVCYGHVPLAKKTSNVVVLDFDVEEGLKVVTGFPPLPKFGSARGF